VSSVGTVRTVGSVDSGTGTSLTFGLRELVWTLESEVAQISSLCRRIDEHVRALNALRAEMVQRLQQLDELVEAADDPDLRSWLESATAPALPEVTELFPDRLYTD
jgi:hypothetical protein